MSILALYPIIAILGGGFGCFLFFFNYFNYKLRFTEIFHFSIVVGLFILIIPWTFIGIQSDGELNIFNIEKFVSLSISFENYAFLCNGMLLVFVFYAIYQLMNFFVHNLEQVIIDVLAHYNIRGTRVSRHRGIFVNNLKIASIGLKVKKWITLHGFSLNVNNDLKYFENIIACGLKDHPQTSIKKVLNRPIPACDVKEQILHGIRNTFKIPVLKIVQLP